MQIKDTVIEILEIFNHDGKGVDVWHLVSEHVQDSMEMVEFVVEIEDEFGIEVTDDETERWPDMTVNQLIEFIEERVK